MDQDAFLDIRILINNFEWDIAWQKIQETAELVPKTCLLLEYYEVKQLREEFIEVMMDFIDLGITSKQDLFPFLVSFQTIRIVWLPEKIQKNLRQKLALIFEKFDDLTPETLAEYFLISTKLTFFYDIDQENASRFLQKYEAIESQLQEKYLKFSRLDYLYIKSFVHSEGHIDTVSVSQPIMEAMENAIKIAGIKYREILSEINTIEVGLTFKQTKNSKDDLFLKIKKRISQLVSIVGDQPPGILLTLINYLRFTVLMHEGKVADAFEIMDKEKKEFQTKYHFTDENIFEKSHNDLYFFDVVLSYLYRRIGETYLVKSDFDAAIKFYNIAYQLRLRAKFSPLPTSTDLLMNTYINVVLGRLTEAEEVYAVFIKTYPIKIPIPFFKNRIDIVQGMILGESSNVRNHFRAIDILQDALKTQRNYFHTFKIGVLSLFKILMFTAANHNDSQALEDSIYYLKMLEADSDQQHDITTLIDAKLLLSKIEILNGRFEKAKIYTLQARELVIENTIKFLENSVERQLETINNLDFASPGRVSIASSLDDQIKKLEINEYLEQALRNVGRKV